MRALYYVRLAAHVFFLLSMLPVIVDQLDEILRSFAEISVLLVAYTDLPGRMCRETIEADTFRLLLYIVVWNEGTGHLRTDHG